DPILLPIHACLLCSRHSRVSGAGSHRLAGGGGGVAPAPPGDPRSHVAATCCSTTPVCGRAPGPHDPAAVGMVGVVTALVPGSLEEAPYALPAVPCGRLKGRNERAEVLSARGCWVRVRDAVRGAVGVGGGGPPGSSTRCDTGGEAAATSGLPSWGFRASIR